MGWGRYSGRVAKILLLYVVPLALMVFALVDCAQDDDVERTQVPKVLWIAFIILLPYAGPIAWLVVGKIARPRQGGQTHPPSSPWAGWGSRRPGSNRPRPRAPDDDPEFLHRLAEEQARKRREENRRQAPKDDPNPS